LVRQARMLRVVIEGVPHGQWLRHSVRPNLDAIFSNDLCLGPVPSAILAGDCELLKSVAVANLQALSHLIEGENDLPPADLCPKVSRSRLSELASVHIGQGPARHPLAYVELVLGMNVLRL